MAAKMVVEKCIKAVVYSPFDGMRGYMDLDVPVTGGDRLLGYAVCENDGTGWREVSALLGSVEEVVVAYLKAHPLTAKEMRWVREGFDAQVAGRTI